MQHGSNEVRFALAGAVVKCAQGLGVEMSNERIQLLIEDITEVYKFDSIEDVQTVLKKIRQGKYGTTYNKLNMIVFQEAMAQHLEIKAAARESENRKAKHDFKTKEEYVNVVKIGLERQKKESEILKQNKYDAAMDEAGYEEFKANYEASKKK